MKMTGEGMLGYLKAKICAEVLSALDDEPQDWHWVHRKKTNLLSNKLIWRYLEFKKCKYTASVLIVESGQTIVPLLSSMNSMTLKNQRIT